MNEELKRELEMIYAALAESDDGDVNYWKEIPSAKPIRTQRGEAEAKNYDKKLVDLLQEVEELAIAGWDGHLTLMRFTTGWKIIFGTPELTFEDRKMIDHLKSYPSLQEALEAGLREKPNAYTDIDLDDPLFGEGFEP